MTESVLFICDDNSILGPMAEAFLRRYGFCSFKVVSAGIHPKPIHLNTFRVMEEIGYDLYGYRSKSIFEFNHLQHVDYLITLTDYVNDTFIFNKDHIGCHLHWPFRLPTLQPIETEGLSCPKPALNIGHLTAGDEPWPASDSLLLKTKQKVKTVLQSPPDPSTPTDIQYLIKRFRLTRDEMECQVMNWLEEKGIGPLWWRG